ncbi:MAG: gamma-glutamyltransferase [Verrucomicrobia bacterium]|nr:MAG: gamma-glutamyltransferase [Verrucomicrobiota bacterium]
MVVTAHAVASEIGIEILRRGGNAVDAAVAVGFALAVVYPRAGNLGGGGFMVLRMADGQSRVIDYREAAPAAAGRDVFLDEEGRVIPGASILGYRAAGIPGTVAGLAFVLERFGTLNLAGVIEPARRLAAEGFMVTRPFETSLRKYAGTLADDPESQRIFLNEGNFWKTGDLFVQGDLAKTLERIQRKGSRGFYRGETADMIVEAMVRNNGLITHEDLTDYRPVEREVLRGTYRGLEILTMPPPSSGGIALLQMLHMLEPYDLGAMGFQGSDTLHLMAETMRRAFRDRAEFPGDPDYVDVPVESLLTREYALGLMQDFDPENAGRSEGMAPGDPWSHESPETTHFSIVDRNGNAVSNTYTLNRAYGSKVTVPGTGVLLNNEMDDFTSKPGVPNSYGLIQGEANAVVGGKRPLSSMTPTLVLRDGKIYLVIGSPGGPKIINIVLQVILNVVDHGMNIQQAIEAPRVHHQWMPDALRYEPFAIAPDTMAILESRGHILVPFVENPPRDYRYWGDAGGILVDSEEGLLFGAGDPRNARSMAIGF